MKIYFVVLFMSVLSPGDNAPQLRAIPFADHIAQCQKALARAKQNTLLERRKIADGERQTIPMLVRGDCFVWTITLKDKEAT